MTPGVLFGARIVVTRPRAQAEELVAPLRERGADVVVCPLIRIEPIAFQVDAAAFDWIVFTSVNGAEAFVQGVAAAPRAAVACVGSTTAALARKLGFDVRAVPQDFVGDAIVDAMTVFGSLDQKRVLLARAAHTENNLAQLLERQGALVEDLPVYRTVADDAGLSLLEQRIAADDVDVITFTSSSAVRHFARRINTVGRARVVVIGPMTANTAEGLGVRVTATAEPHTIEGMIRAIEKVFREA